MVATTSPHKIIGTSVAQPQGVAKVLGIAKYTLDMSLPGQLWAKVLRSPVPHARIRSIDTEAAKALPGVRAIITAADLPQTNYGRLIKDLPPLARDTVRFAGEKVAAVAADSQSIAEEAIKLIDVDYEELPAVFDPLEAMKDGAPLVHESFLTYEGHWEDLPEIPNVYSAVRSERGDVQRGFEESDVIFEHTFKTPSQHHAYLEPHGVVVNIDEAGRIHVWLSNKTPHTGRQQLSALLAVPQEQIVMHISHIGGDFGGKGSVMDAPLCYYLARLTGRPVKIVMDYKEELAAGNPRHPSVITIRTGVKKDGRIWACQMTSIWNTGAYCAFLPNGRVGGGGRTGSYEIPHVSIESYCVHTNCTPRGHMRAPGSPQAMFAIESNVDMIAHAMGIDPVEFRLLNSRAGDPRTEGQSQDRGHETLLAASAAGRWTEPKAPNRGRGVSFFEHGVGRGQASVTLSVDADGSLELLAAAPDTGTGSHTIMQQVVAEELSLDTASIRVTARDTDATEPDSGVGGSRVSHVYGQATLSAARDMRSILIQVAASLMESRPEQVILDAEGFVSVPGPEQQNPIEERLSFSEVARRAVEKAGGSLSVVGNYTGQSGSTTSYNAQLAHVEVDPETGGVKILKLITAHDVGTILNPIGHQGQINGGIIQGLGFALMEELVIDEGRVGNLSFADYKIPVIGDIPELVTILLENPEGPVPYQGKAIGETSNCPTAAAVANAVFDACGVRITELPITAERVLRGLRQLEALS